MKQFRIVKLTNVLLFAEDEEKAEELLWEALSLDGIDTNGSEIELVESEA